MQRILVTVGLALAGLVCAAGIGAAAFVVSRDSVGLPVTRLQPRPSDLAPARVRSRPKPAATTTTPPTITTTPAPTTTTGRTAGDDHGGDD